MPPVSTTRDAVTARATIGPLVGRFLTPEQVAEILALDVDTVLRMARRGAMPGAFKVGKPWRFHAAPFTAWTRGWWDPTASTFDAWLTDLQP